MSTHALDTAAFLSAFGAPQSDGAIISDEVAKFDFRYDRLAPDERDAVILSVLDKIDGATLVGEHRHNIWEMAWSDVAKRYRETGDLSSLEPSFIGGSAYIRLLGDYARPLKEKFEFNYFRVLRTWLFRKFLADATHVYEFGCGSGFNLAALAQMFPDKQLVGLDWATAAVDVINEFSGRFDFNLKGQRFNFFEPSASLEFGPKVAAMTFCALEQTGERFKGFIDWLLEQKPGIVVSMEPTPEFYDANNLYDSLALRYHTKRQYLSGYYTYLRKLADEGKIDLIISRRLNMGSQFHEGYSLLVWRPRRGIEAS